MLIGNRLSAADKRRLAMLYANNQGGNLRQQLLDGAPFLAELTHTAVPQRAAPGTTATFTRATTKTIPDHEGVLRTLIAGELGFPGARREYNLWGTASSTLANGANNSMTLPAGAYQFSMGAGTGTATFSGTGGATGTLAASASGRAFVAKTITAGTLVVTASVADLIDLQVVSMVGCSDQTTIREYVPIGVESAPYYHGSMADGVKCFDTDLSGNPLTTMLGYLAEGARTNLWTYSQDFDNAAWPKSTITVAANDAVAPDGTTTADKLTNDDTASGLDRTVTVTANTTYTDSIHLKYGNNAWARILYGSGVDAVQLFVNIQTGTIGTVSTGGGTAVLSAYSIESVSGGFWRIQAAVNLGGAITGFQRRSYLVNADNSGTIVAAAYAHYWGAQLELGSFASSYIPTTTVAVTRNADVLTYPSAGNILGTVGWAYAEWTYPRAATTTTSPRIINTGAGSVPLYLASAIAGDLGLYDGAVRDGPTPAYPVTTPTKSASTWGGTAATITNAGVSVTTAFDGDMNVGSTIDIACINGTGGFELNGTIRNVRIGQRQLSASELQAVTS